MSDCGEVVAAIVPAPVVMVEPSGMIAAPLAGLALTVCKLPSGMIGGLIGMVSAAGDVHRGRGHHELLGAAGRGVVLGVDPQTRATVNTSPLFRVEAPEAQPLVIRLLPVWPAPKTSGVALVKLPVVWV